jgi:hypothetical protein
MLTKLNDVLHISAIFILSVWLFAKALLYQAEYPTRLVELYEEPLWKGLLIALVLSSFIWSPVVGILLTFAVIMYFTDLESISDIV